MNVDDIIYDPDEVHPGVYMATIYGAKYKVIVDHTLCSTWENLFEIRSLEKYDQAATRTLFRQYKISNYVDDK